MKKLIATLVSAALLTSTASAASWPSWAADTRGWAEETAISQPFLQAPEAVVSRAQAAQLLYEAAGRPAVSGGNPFSDVSGPYADAVAWAAGQGYVCGVGEGKFLPDAPVTRQQFAVILCQQAGFPEVSGRELDGYRDRKAVASWAENSMLWCVKTGLISGRTADTLAPDGQITTAEALTMLRQAQLLPDVDQLRRDLEALTASHRPIGSQGERDAAQYLRRRFREMGYDVTLQTYTDAEGRQGTNVIAVKEAKKKDADILVLSAHHDSVPTAYGANDNASGVAALLAAAELLKDLPTDTELRFISFTDEENGKNGSRFYTDTLGEKERARMIGDIQFDMLGGLGTSGVQVCTADGEANWVSDLLREKNAGLTLGAETASDHAAFQLAGVPSVLLMQNGRGYLYHSAADRADQLDLWSIGGAVRTAVAGVEEVSSNRTGSYRALADAQGAGYTYRQTRQNVIYFDSSRSDTEAYVGAAGELTDHREVSGNGWTDTYDTYRYSMRWFDGETPMNTYYQYRNGFLQNIEIRPWESGYSTQQIRNLIGAMYGAPTSSGTNRQGEPYESWVDEIYGKYITLTDGQNGGTVTVSKYAVGITNVLASYPVRQGQAEIQDPKHQQVWDLLCTILPEENRKKITEFNLFTDGASNVLAYTSPIREDGKADNTRFAISVDYYDVYDENGVPRDWSKLTYTILHEYGHVLLEDETQVDLTVGENTHDPAGFVPGSLRKAFYDKFWADLGASGVGDYEQHPTNYVSRYGANYFHEDIADTFAVFLLGGEPTGDTVAEEKLRFFWDYPEMVELRTAVRANLKLEKTEAPVAVATMEELKEQLARAIAGVEQPPAFDVSALPPQSDWAMTAKNLYFNLQSQNRDYVYAYDFRGGLGEDGLLRCTISYMPYRTGAFPAGFEGKAVNGLADLMETAREGLEQEEIAIRITDPDLLVDDMNRALQQVGGGYLLCALNRDGTAIQIKPMNGLTHREAQEQLAEIDALADQVFRQCVRPGMTQAEEAKALYAYLTEQVRYDFRYYSDLRNMPYDSTTALGALRDHLAICGGYAQALQSLFERAGIPCLTVTGQMGGENHMWNQAYLDGEWHWFDATSDRGRANYGFHYFMEESEQMTRYVWDREQSERLSRAVAG